MGAPLLAWGVLAALWWFGGWKAILGLILVMAVSAFIPLLWRRN